MKRTRSPQEGEGEWGLSFSSYVKDLFVYRGRDTFVFNNNIQGLHMSLCRFFNVKIGQKVLKKC